MSPVEFNPEDREFKSSPRANSGWEGPKPSKMVEWVLKAGVVKNEQQANYVLLGIAGIFFIASIYLLFGQNFSTQNTEVQYREDIPPEILQQIPPEMLNQIPSRNE